MGGLSMSENNRISQPKSQGGPVGSQLEPVYTSRKMTLYSLNESEIQTVSDLSDRATLAYSLSSFLISQGFAIHISAAFSDSLNAAGELAVSYVSPLLLILGFVALIWGLAATRKRGRFWSNIKANSRNVE